MYAFYLTDVIAITVVTWYSNLVPHHYMRKNETMMICFGIQKTNTNKVLSQTDIIPTKPTSDTSLVAQDMLKSIVPQKGDYGHY